MQCVFQSLGRPHDVHNAQLPTFRVQGMPGQEDAPQIVLPRLRRPQQVRREPPPPHLASVLQKVLRLPGHLVAATEMGQSQRRNQRKLSGYCDRGIKPRRQLSVRPADSHGGGGGARHGNDSGDSADFVSYSACCESNAACDGRGCERRSHEACRDQR